MDRRAFIGVLGAAVITAPLAAEAQQAKVYRVGLLLQGSAPPPGSKPGIFRDTLRELGYVEGRNLILHTRWAEGEVERFPSLAAELVALKPDALVVNTTPGTLATIRATATIPIVMVEVSDPVGSGFVTSLARPGGNVTGVADLGNELSGKAVELVHEAIPRATRIAVLVSDNPVHARQLKEIHDAANRIGLTVLPTKATSFEGLEEAFASMAKGSAMALILLGGPPFTSQRALKKILELAVKAKLPTMCTYVPTRGGLIGYGPRGEDQFRLAATYVDKILKGAKPADLPVEQPTKFELVINLKTAKALGLTIPPSLLQRADQVIE